MSSTRESDIDEFGLPDSDDGDCQTCGGEGYTECDDFDSSEGCWTHDNCNGFGFCPNCRGSGRAKDQRYW